MNAKEAVILFFSRSGNTRHIADDLKERLEGHGIVTDLFEILIEGKLSYTRMLRISKNQSKIRFIKTDCDLSGYNMVIMGTPIWGGKPSVAFIKYMDHVFLDPNARIGIFLDGMGGVEDNEVAARAMEEIVSERGFQVIDRMVLRFWRGKLIDGEDNIQAFIDSMVKSLD
jgi:hypothetical protein